MTPATFPHRALFIHWKRAVDLRLYEYAGKTLHDFGQPARAWWALWRAGWPAQTVAEVLTR
jgi:hypothetical protein